MTSTIREALGVFASAIKSGEQWTPTCEAALTAAKAELDAIERRKSERARLDAIENAPSRACEKALRKQVMSAIRSYGYSKQDKGDIESRTDGVMIAVAEHVRAARPSTESDDAALVEELSELIMLKHHAGFHRDAGNNLKTRDIPKEAAKAIAETAVGFIHRPTRHVREICGEQNDSLIKAVRHVCHEEIHEVQYGRQTTEQATEEILTVVRAHLGTTKDNHEAEKYFRSLMGKYVLPDQMTEEERRTLDRLYQSDKRNGIEGQKP